MITIDYNKVRTFLFTLATKSTLSNFNPNNFSNVSSLHNILEPNKIEEEYSSDSMPLYFYEKYKWIPNRFGGGYWSRTQIFLSRYMNLEYEKPFEEKLASTLYDAITEEQYQALLEYEKKNKKGRRGL